MVLDIKNLTVSFNTTPGQRPAVKQLSLQIPEGSTVGLVGESGSGKSVTALAVMQLLPVSARTSGDILFTPPATAPFSRPALENAGIPLLQMSPAELRHIRGGAISMIFQEPMTSLNPVFRCGDQVTEAIRLHRSLSKKEAREQALALFERVKISDPGRIFRAYPHEISGGQKQRVMIAMALSCQPALLIADEPTTALDTTVQKAILDLLQEIKEQDGLSMLFISHDLSVVADVADQVAVMMDGQIVENGPIRQILNQPGHAYTRGLLACRPSLHRKMHRLPTIESLNDPPLAKVRQVTPAETEQRRARLYQPSPLLEVNHLSVRYRLRKPVWTTGTRTFEAVRDVSFAVYPGEIFGIAGESGSGKSTLGRVIAMLQTAASGEVWYRKLPLAQLPKQDIRNVRREIQMVFQDPYSSLNPRMTVGDALLETLQAYQLYASERQRREKVMELLESVGLDAAHARRYPREFSGGQRQRICLARALALQPKLLVCDEMVSALDVSVQAAMLNLLLDLQEQFGLTYLFISHDLRVIRQMCDRLLVLREGEAVALGHPEEMFEQPENAYVRDLVSSIPSF